MIQGERGNWLNPLQWRGRRTTLVPTNTRWIGRVFTIAERRDAWAFECKRFSIVFYKGRIGS